jgi:hypothetical protein
MKTFIAIGAMLIAALAQAQATDEVAVAQQAINRHFDIWNDRNAAHWDAKLPQVYTADVLVADYGGLATGYADIRRLLERVQADHPGFVFTPAPRLEPWPGAGYLGLWVEGEPQPGPR